LPEAGEEKSPLSHPVFKPVSLPDFQIGDDGLFVHTMFWQRGFTDFTA